jgi:heme/copper-type cytochrome/quinol oxidase subunit 2
MNYTAVHTALLELLKLIITVSMGLLSLSIAFIDKINLDLKNKTIRTAITSFWIFLVITIFISLITCFFIFTDVGDSIRASKSEIGYGTRIFGTLTFISFLLILIFLMRIGFFIIKKKQNE